LQTSSISKAKEKVTQIFLGKLAFTFALPAELTLCFRQVTIDRGQLPFDQWELDVEDCVTSLQSKMVIKASFRTAQKSNTLPKLC